MEESFAVAGAQSTIDSGCNQGGSGNQIIPLVLLQSIHGPKAEQRFATSPGSQESE